MFQSLRHAERPRDILFSTTHALIGRDIPRWPNATVSKQSTCYLQTRYRHQSSVIGFFVGHRMRHEQAYPFQANNPSISSDTDITNLLVEDDSLLVSLTHVSITSFTGNDGLCNPQPSLHPPCSSIHSLLPQADAPGRNHQRLRLSQYRTQQGCTHPMQQSSRRRNNDYRI